MLSNILYTEYMSEDEKNLAIELETADIKLDRAVSAYVAICEKATLDLREAELQCFQESGNLDDLAQFYMEADQKTSDKKEGLLKTIWNALINAFTKVKEFFFGKKDEINPDDSYEEDTGAKSALRKFLDTVNGILRKGVKAISDMAAWKKALAIIGVAGVGAGVAYAFHKNSKKKVTGDEVAKANEEIGGFVEKIQETIKHLTEISGNTDPASKEYRDELVNQGYDKKTANQIAGVNDNKFAEVIQVLKSIPKLITEFARKIWVRKNVDPAKGYEKQLKQKGYKKKDAKNIANATGTGEVEESAFESAYDNFIPGVTFESSNDYEDDIYNDDPYGETMTESMDDIDHLLDDLLG